MVTFHAPDVGCSLVQVRDRQLKSQPHGHDAASIKILNSHDRLVKLIGRNQFKG